MTTTSPDETRRERGELPAPPAGPSRELLDRAAAGWERFTHTSAEDDSDA
ncbi:hypothetical protein [Streptomyces sp. NPDC058279]